MDCLVKRGYLDRSSASGNASKDSNNIRTACLNFAREHSDLIRQFSKREIQIVVGSGCPSLDRKVVNSAKRLRSHVGIDEREVCSSCNLRGSCDRAYTKARENEGGRTVDVVRILLTYGLNVVTGTIDNQACMTKVIKESVRKLLTEVVDFTIKELNSNTPEPDSESSRGHQMKKSRNTVPMKQGDWICPKCNFMNFAKNINCLSCNGLFEDRLRKLHKDLEHLPLKKGDWICKTCNFLNFAKNPKCLQCHEPPMRELTPGEWECLSCHYINFRRNMLCLKCNWKRPKVSASGDMVAETPYTRPENSFPSTRSISDSRYNGNHFSCHRTLSEELNIDIWSSDEDQAEKDNSGDWPKLNEFDDFPIVGGKGVTSQDPLARERWKEAMLKKSKGISESSNENNGELSFAKFCNKELDEGSDDDDIAGWFK